MGLRTFSSFFSSTSFLSDYKPALLLLEVKRGSEAAPAVPGAVTTGSSGVISHLCCGSKDERGSGFPSVYEGWLVIVQNHRRYFTGDYGLHVQMPADHKAPQRGREFLPEFPSFHIRGRRMQASPEPRGLRIRTRIHGLLVAV